MTVVAAVIGLLLLQEAAVGSPWTIEIASDITVHMNDVVSVQFTIPEVPTESKFDLVPSSDGDIAKSSLHLSAHNKTSFNGVVNVTGVFLGTTKLTFTLISEVNNWEVSNIVV